MINTEHKSGKKTIFTKKVKDYIFAYGLLAIPILYFLVFWLYLNFSSILLAFQDEFTGEFTTQNFTRLFEDFAQDWKLNRGVKTAVENTFITAFLTMFVSMPTTVFVTYILFKKYFAVKIIYAAELAKLT